jgi:hypothetical protein
MRNSPKAREAELLAELQTMLNDVLTAKSAGESYSRLARAHGYVDGFIRALEATGSVDKKKLLAAVADARAKMQGPAIRLGDDAARFRDRRRAS